MEFVDSDNETTGEPTKFVAEKVTDEKEPGKECYRVSVNSKEEAIQWLGIYQKQSRTHWIVHKTFPDRDRYTFRKVWKCNLSERNKAPDGLRNQHCPATLEIKIKLVTKDTKKKDKFIGKHDPPLPCIVTIDSRHNHHIDVSDTMQYLRGDEKLRKKFEEYFDDRMKPGEAMRLHEEKLALEDKGEELLADAHYNPKANTVYWWHQEWRKKNFGPPQDPLSMLEIKCKDYEIGGSTVVVSKESPYCVLVCTPIMKRAHNLATAEEIAFIDTTGTVDASHSNVTVISTASKIGAVPMAIIMHENQKEPCYTKAFDLFKTSFPKAFHGKTEPQVFMTDNSAAEKNAIRNVWPESDQLLCHFHVVQQEWTWLLSSKHGVEADKRQYYIKAVQKIMYAKSTEELTESIENFNKAVDHEGYKKRINDFLDRKEEWVSLFRDFLLMRGHHTNNFSEATIRILKDVILQRIKAYNLVALINYIVTVWQNYMRNRILRVAYNRDSKPVLVYEATLRKIDIDLANKIVKVDEDTFMVPSATTSELMYEVNRSLGVCNCKAGCSGAFCKHQALLHSVEGGCFPNAPPILSSDRYQLGLLAMGEKCPPPKFFLGLKEGLDGGTPLNLQEDTITSMDLQENTVTSIEQQAEDAIDINQVTNNIQEESSFTTEEKAGILKQFGEEWERLHDLAGNEDKYFEYMQKAIKGLKKVTTGSGATSAMVNVADSLKGYSSSSVRLGRMKVLGKSIARRPPNAPRTSNRLPAGRKPGKASATQEEDPSSSLRKTKSKKIKRRRQIAESIRNNIAHVKSH